MTPIPASPRPKPKNLVQSIARASSILDALSQHSQGIGLGELSQTVGLSKGTTHRLVTTLVYLGFARQLPLSQKYHLGFKLVELGNTLLKQLDLKHVARPHLIALAEEVQETVHLVVRDGDQALYIDKVNLDYNQSGLQMVSRLGSRTPMHCSSVGKVLLAYMPENEVAEMVKRTGLPARTATTISESGELKKQLDRVRLQGYAIDKEENELGIRCIGAPVVNEAGLVVAAISVSGPTVRLTLNLLEKVLSRKVCRAAMEISRELGFRGPGSVDNKLSVAS